ncbi:hypothetical protein HanXRQr2_Chr10g0423281 [Helianthus annuus]|uniref:Uncharacterized protein n=2 Tax=Helianthus annuus TaxID=4232 RepID=A0A9K3N3G4_HELAN|nr:hypothetical protein HanXRQr2_Chr10g0423281 [Helianthus annuus]
MEANIIRIWLYFYDARGLNLGFCSGIEYASSICFFMEKLNGPGRVALHLAIHHLLSSVFITIIIRQKILPDNHHLYHSVFIIFQNPS